MNNPFDEFDKRLINIESLLLNLQPKESLPKDEPYVKPINTKELCAFLGITEPTVIRWRKKKKIPFFQIGSAVRFNLSEVLKSLGK